MEVRRTPSTQVDTGQRGYQQASPVDYSGIVEAVDNFANAREQRQKDAQEFELQRRLITDANNQREQYNQMRLDPNVDFRQFSDTIATEFERQDEAALAEYRGYDRELVREFQLRQDTRRSQLFADALGHEVIGYRTQAGVDADDYLAESSRTVTTDWTTFEAVNEQWLSGIEVLSNLTPEERMQRAQAGTRVLRLAATRSWALSDAQSFLAAADPNGRYAPEEAPAVTGSAASVVGTNVLDLIRDKEGFRTDAYWDRDHFRTGYGSDTATRADGTVEVVTRDTVVTREDAERDLLRRTGGLSEQIGQRAPGWEQLGANAQAAIISTAYNYGVGHERLEPVWAAIASGDREELAAIIEGFQHDNEGINRERRLEEAALIRSDVAPSTAAQTPASSFAVPESAQELDITDPLILALEGDERLELIGLAQAQVNRSQTEQRAAMEVLVNNVKAESLANGGQVASPIPSEAELIQSHGTIIGPQIYAGMNQAISVDRAIPGFATLSPGAIEAQLDRLRPVAGSPTFQSQLPAYQAAEAARDRILAERQADPAAFALRHYPSVSAAAARGIEEYYTAMRTVLTELDIDPATVPLMPEAAIQRQVQQYEIMPTVQRVEWIAEQYRTLGADGFQSFIGNFNGTSAQRDMRMFEVMRYAGGSPAVSRDLIRQAIEGQEIAQRDPSRRPLPTVLQRYRVNMEKTLGIGTGSSRLNPDVSTAIQNVAAGLYVSRGGDPRQLNTEIYDQALADALGGSLPANLQRGSAKSDTILPSGVTSAEFDAWTDSLTAERLRSITAQIPVREDLRTRITASEIADFGVFVMVTPGIYEIRMGDTPNAGTVMNTEGRPYRLRLSRAQ